MSSCFAAAPPTRSAKADAEMDARGTDRLNINARGRRYFSNNVARERPELRSFLLSALMADICRATLGDTAYLFNEQYVIKCADRDTAFAWHQDSGYIHERHEPYLTCWIALDDVDESNGAVYLLPFSQVGIRTYVRHVKNPDVNDMVGYFGSAPGVAVEARTGSIVCFSSVAVPPQRTEPDRSDAPGLRRPILIPRHPRRVPFEPLGWLRTVPRRRPHHRRHWRTQPMIDLALVTAISVNSQGFGDDTSESERDRAT